MKKFLSTLALVLAISSVSMAKSSSKKSVVHHKKAQACVVIYCDGAGHIIGMVSNAGVIYGDICGNCC